MIVVFAGAGASKATNSEMYPTTIEFLEKLPLEMTSDQLFIYVQNYLRFKSGDDAAIDIEELLWALHDLSEFALGINDQKTVIGWFLTGARILKSIGKNYDLNPLLEAAPQIERPHWRIHRSNQRPSLRILRPTTL